ncbi:class I histocompatibility antigen, F10 alpha chain-like isoform X1 [Chrysemys picta bellii]|uniref:class I histocompatibility antigen, F10 alpha chain-like isoform X1 n=1 Tax=Chrysemys picta bellii TaxID=8478 RepID=UPI0032B295AA
MALALRLLLLGAVALPGGHCRLHSRRILDTVVSEPAPGLPWYSRVVYVDDQLTYVYTSGTKRAEPYTLWMAQNEGSEFWDEVTWWGQRFQKWYNASLNTLSQLYNRTEGVEKPRSPRKTSQESSSGLAKGRFSLGWWQHYQAGVASINFSSPCRLPPSALEMPEWGISLDNIPLRDLNLVMSELTGPPFEPLALCPLLDLS